MGEKAFSGTELREGVHPAKLTPEIQHNRLQSYPQGVHKTVSGARV